MSEQDMQRLVAVLEEIRDNQKIQLERQAEAFALQREQFAMVQKQYERTERIQDRAEALQNMSAKLVSGSRKAVALVLPVIIVLVIYLSWLLFRRY